MSGLRSSGPYVPLEEVPWLPEVAEHDTPEYLLDALREARAKRARDELSAYLSLIPEREALALMLHEGLFGHAPRIQSEVAKYIGANSQQAACYIVRRAKARIQYLLARPPIDEAKLSSVLSAPQLGVVRDVYEVASFTEVGRRRWPCPETLSPKQRHQWTRNRYQRVKRAFFFAMEKVERAGLHDQHAALLHVVEHLGALRYHEGKGRR